MSQRVERGNASAHQRRGLGRVERFRHLRQRFHRRHHVFLIAAVVADSANLHVCAVHEVSAAAGETSAVLPPVPTHSNALAFPPFLHSCTEFIDHAGHLVAWDAWVRYSGEKTFLRDHIAVTDSTGLHVNPHLSRTRLLNFALHDFTVRSRLRHLDGFHFRHCFPPFTSDFFTWRSLLPMDFNTHLVNESPNIGRPLFDCSCVASSSITSQCSTRVPSLMRTMSAAIQFTG